MADTQINDLDRYAHTAVSAFLSGYRPSRPA